MAGGRRCPFTRARMALLAPVQTRHSLLRLLRLLRVQYCEQRLCKDSPYRGIRKGSFPHSQLHSHPRTRPLNALG